MKKTLSILLALFCTIAFAELPKESKEQIDAAIPAKSFVKPAKKHKILVVNLHVNKGKVGKGHPSTPYGDYMLSQLGKKTGAFECVFDNDSLAFRKENLEQFDAICFNNTAGVLFQDEQLRQNLLDFVKSGKGFIGIHAAGATFVQWPVYDQFPEFGVMLGGYEAGGHPWKPHEWIILKIDEPDHPLNQMWSKKTFPVSDEVFQFQTPYSRDKLKVLLSIDTKQTNMSEERYILPERRADQDLAISWVKKYGDGRVFYTSLGHNAHIYWDKEIVQHYLAGIQYVLGDLKADDTPSKVMEE